jgi:peptidoglycan/LPS O-acetylase OafA/YrhL
MATAGTSGRPAARSGWIDGLRCFAALSVLLVHTWEVGPSGKSQWGSAFTYISPVGQAALAMFFTLSGYLIYRMYVGPAIRGRGYPSTGAFLFNRVLRLFPNYWLILTVAALAGAAGQAGGNGLQGGGFDGVGTAVANYTLLQTYFPHTILSGIGAAWSLTVEIAFYLSIPILAAIVVRRAEGKTGRAQIIAYCMPAVALLLLGVAGKWVVHHIVGLTTRADTTSFVLQQSFLSKADLVSWGMMVAVVTTALPRERWSRWPTRRLALTGLVTIVIGIVGGNTVFMAFGCAAILLWSMISHANGTPSRPARFISAPTFAYLGLISYSIYLWHGPVLIALNNLHALPSGWAGVFTDPLIVAGITLPLSALTYRYVEAWSMERFKMDLTPSGRPAPVPVEAAASKAAP